MATYFAFKLADAYQQRVDELLKNLDTHVAAPQHGLHTQVSIEIADEILKYCVEELVAHLQTDEGTRILNTLLSLLKGTSHVLIRQMLGKSSNAEVNKMADYIRSRRVEVGSNVLYGFELPATLATQFRQIFAAINAGNGEAQKAALTTAMLSFGDAALQHFYDDFIAPMDLGFIKRKASELGRGTLHKGIQVAINKLFPSLDPKELAIFADYYGSLFVDV